MPYLHTQRGPLHYILNGVATILIVSAWLTRGEPIIATVLGLSGCLLLLFALCFRSLTVTDEGERLSIHFGPIPLFRKSIKYSTGAEHD